MVLVSVCFTSASASGSQGGPEPKDRPNILVMLTVDQGWGDLSYHRNTQLYTPHLDQLARESVRFANFYIQPVCAPTRAEFLTGRYHPRSGVYANTAGGERLDADEKTIADFFRETGYFTATFGKWHSGQQWLYHLNACGYEYFYGLRCGHWGHYYDYILEKKKLIIPNEGYIAYVLTGKVMKTMTLAKSSSDQPFFMVLNYNTPHSPMQVRDKYWQGLRDQPIRQRASAPEKEDPGHTRAGLAMVENIDDNAGRLFRFLEQLDINENTLVVFFSDNGPNDHRWNGGMRGRKGSVDESGVRPPLFLRWPSAGLEKGRSIEDVASAVDLLPTLVSFAGISSKSKKPLDGRDLNRLILGRNSHFDNDRLLFNRWRDRISVRSQQFRLDSEGRLYDMSKDRAQTRDVSENYPEIPGIIANKFQMRAVSRLE